MFFVNPGDVQDYLLNDIAQGCEDVARLLNVALGKKQLPLRKAALPMPMAGAHLAVRFRDNAREILPDRCRFEKDKLEPATHENLKLLARFLTDAIDIVPEKLWSNRPDGIPKPLAKGFDYAVAQARRHFYGTKRLPAYRSPLKLELGTWDTRINVENYAGLSPESVMKMLCNGLADKLPREKPLTFKLFSHDTRGIDTTLSCENIRSCFFTSQKAASFHINVSSSQKGIAKQIMANRVALTRFLKIPVMETNFGLVGSYAFARFGFLPNEKWWRQVSCTAGKRLDEMQAKGQLAPGQFRHIREILESPDPRSIWKIADLDMKAGDEKVGFILLFNNRWIGRLHLSDPEQMSRFRAYVGLQIYDEAHNLMEKIRNRDSIQTLGSTSVRPVRSAPSPARRDASYRA